MSNDFFEKAKRMFERDEGRSNTIYSCPAGKTTIGIGHNLEAKGISNTTIDQIFAEDLSDCVRSAIDIFGAAWGEFSENRQLAILNLIFNLGEFGFRKFEMTIDAILKGDWQAASERVLVSKYATQVGQRAHRVASMLRDDSFPYA